ncbi:MAG: 23S rRNA (pseudouridine1915-N3)-methyltransferase [Lentisphaeria bacterium]|jgi:23S rRNA (pseudouridine1915-N3)-methyltransferase
MPAWVEQGYAEYAKRLPRDLTPQLMELPLANRSKSTSTAKVKNTEGEQILAAIPKGAVVVALDVLGKALSTKGLAQKLETWQMNGSDVCLVIGGPNGLSDACLKIASERWSLSALTLPHPLVRVVLIEQIYRAWTILQNHPYHK